jgi:hypothetical protein
VGEIDPHLHTPVFRRGSGCEHAQAQMEGEEDRFHDMAVLV